MNVSRRTFLGGVAALPAILSIPERTTAMTEAARTTLVLSPHPDDEVINLAHYIAYAADRGDRLILVEATDGCGTRVGRELGLTPEQTTLWRYREQDHAWEWLTGGRGEIVRLGMHDMQADSSTILDALTPLVADPTTELYVASWHYDRPEAVQANVHPDHVACVDAARVLQSRGTIVRYAVHPSAGKVRSAKYRAEGHRLLRVQGAVDSYQVIGRRSTRTLDLVLDGQTRVTR